MLKVFELRQPSVETRGKEHARQDSQWLPAHRDETPRNFTWGFLDGLTHVRAQTAISKMFIPTMLPIKGEIVFAFDAAPKVGRGGTADNKKPNRRPLPPSQYQEWLQRKLSECGIEASSVEISTSIETVAEHNFVWPAMSVVGEGRIIDETLYRKAILHGIPGSGPKCWGFGMLIVNQ